MAVCGLVRGVINCFGHKRFGDGGGRYSILLALLVHSANTDAGPGDGGGRPRSECLSSFLALLVQKYKY